MNMSSEVGLTEQKKIQEAINCLEEILSERPFPVSIMIETSEDEAIIVGTNQAFIWLVSRILRALQDTDIHQAQRVKFDNCETKCVALEKVFNSLGHIVPSSLCITYNDEDSRKVIEFFRRINP